MALGLVPRIDKISIKLTFLSAYVYLSDFLKTLNTSENAPEPILKQQLEIYLLKLTQFVQGHEVLNCCARIFNYRH